MAMCVSVSGGASTIKLLPVSIDHWEGAVKVVPLAVVLGVSAANSSGTDFACPDCDEA
jgi:hypothetical protein